MSRRVVCASVGRWNGRDEVGLLVDRGQGAGAEPGVPGWSMAVDDLFPPEGS